LSDCSVGTDDFYGDYLASVTPCQQCRQGTRKYSATHQCAVYHALHSDPLVVRSMEG